MIEWAPIVDALATILIIPSYRNTFLFWKKPIQQSVTVIPQTKARFTTTVSPKKGYF
jgi:hypothetical protein